MCLFWARGFVRRVEGLRGVLFCVVRFVFVWVCLLVYSGFLGLRGLLFAVDLNLYDFVFWCGLLKLRFLLAWVSFVLLSWVGCVSCNIINDSLRFYWCYYVICWFSLLFGRMKRYFG